GHTYVFGGDRGFQSDAPRVMAGLMGVDFDDHDQAAYHRIKEILPGDNSDPQYFSPLQAPDCKIRSGDYLIAVDGKEIPRAENVYAAFLGKQNALVSVTYNAEPTAEGADTYTFEPIGNDMELRYLRWVNQRRAMVDEATQGTVAYVHLPDMGERGLIEFAKVYYSSFYKKAFIIDDRYNGGGFTADMILDRLERKLWSLTIPREGNILRNPENVFYGPLTVIVNEDTGSCGEYFATAFRAKKMGKIIGMRTWGGAVGIEPHQNLVDGGVVTPPQFAPYSPFTNDWQFEGWGVEPDIMVQNLPGDVIRGKDAQLEKAIETALGEMKDFFKEWDELPPPPAYPDKR
ncbi:MAG: S41 family peptidase, partial [Planctomycetota bacterium]